MLTTILPTLLRVTQQKVASLGGLHAAIAGVTVGADLTEPFRVLFWNDAGQTAIWPLAGVSSNGNDACCALLPGSLIVATKNSSQQVVIQEFTLPPDPFGSAPVFSIAPDVFGDGDSRQTEFVSIPSGPLIAVTQQNALPAVDCKVRLATGLWIPAQRLTVGTTNGNSFQMTACLAPWDKSLFVANMIDGASGIDARTFAVSANGTLTSKLYLPQVINRQTVNGSFVMGDLANNGEDPALVAVADLTNNRVLLSYTNATFPGDGTRQAIPVLAAIQPGIAPVMVTKSSEFVLSILNPAPVCSRLPGITLSYVVGYPTPNEIHSVTQKIPLGSPIVAFSTTTRDFVIIQPDGTVALVQIDTGAPIGIQPPVVELGVLIGAKLVSFSWSGSDPANAGLYMLQQSPTPTGPWSNVNDTYPIGVQATTVQQFGQMLIVDGVYYRLLLKS